MDSGQNPVESCFRVYLVGVETVYVDLYDTANQKVKKPTLSFWCQGLTGIMF